MKKILVLSDLSFWPCIICALIKITPLKNSEIKFKFVSQEKFVETLGLMVENYDILIGIGYEEMLICQELLVFGEKLLILSATENEDEFIPFFFDENFQNIQKENLNLMTSIIEIANGRINADLLIDYDPEELANILNPSEPDLDEFFCETKERYDRVQKVIQSIYPEEEVRFHKDFFLEMAEGENIAWIEEILEKYEPMERETRKLIKKIHPCEKLPSIGLVTSKDYLFFENDVINVVENSKYITIAIEYRDINGDRVTILAEKFSKNMYYLNGGITKNWRQVISRFN